MGCRTGEQGRFWIRASFDFVFCRIGACLKTWPATAQCFTSVVALLGVGSILWDLRLMTQGFALWPEGYGMFGTQQKSCEGFRMEGES